MSEQPQPDKKPLTPVIQILNQIRNNEIKPADLNQDVRVECVDYLWMTEAQPTGIIANLLGVDERTIRRDKDEIRKRNAKKLSTEDSLELMGELLEKATSTHEHLMRLARSKEGSVQEKSQAGFYVWKAIEGQIKILQNLGYAPSKPMQIEADIHHHQEEEISVEQLKAELAEMEKVVSEDKINDPEIMELIKTAKEQIAIAEANKALTSLKTLVEKNKKQSGDSNEQSP